MNERDGLTELNRDSDRLGLVHPEAAAAPGERCHRFVAIGEIDPSVVREALYRSLQRRMVERHREGHHAAENLTKVVAQFVRFWRAIG